MTTRFTRFAVLPVLAIWRLTSLSTSQLLPEWSALLPQAEGMAHAHVERAFGRLPLYFEENRGQVNERVAYTIKGADKTVYFTPTGVTFVLTAAQDEDARSDGAPSESALLPPDALSEHEGSFPSTVQRRAVKLDFVGTRQVQPVGVK